MQPIFLLSLLLLRRYHKPIGANVEILNQSLNFLPVAFNNNQVTPRDAPCDLFEPTDSDGWRHCGPLNTMASTAMLYVAPFNIFQAPSSQTTTTRPKSGCWNVVLSDRAVRNQQYSKAKNIHTGQKHWCKTSSEEIYLYDPAFNRERLNHYILLSVRLPIAPTSTTDLLLSTGVFILNPRCLTSAIHQPSFSILLNWRSYWRIHKHLLRRTTKQNVRTRKNEFLTIFLVLAFWDSLVINTFL